MQFKPGTKTYVPADLVWAGPVSMLEAKWTDKNGSTVRFKLLESDPEKRNPFVEFTKRRKGRAGTRFRMVCTIVKPPCQVIYDNEVMLAGWADSQTTGHSVTFWLSSDHMGHPFEGYYRGQEDFVVALKEIDDDETIIDAAQRDKVEQAKVKPSSRLSYAAVMLCKNSDFWQWINIYGDLEPGGEHDVNTTEKARAWLLGVMDISSRAELDKIDDRGNAFIHTVQRPFSRWLGEQQYGH
jgi:hypothetical protein